jgi:hypothetical protein
MVALSSPYPILYQFVGARNGSYWKKGIPLVESITQCLESIVSSDYIASLAEYGVAGQPIITGYVGNTVLIEAQPTVGPLIDPTDRVLLPVDHVTSALDSWIASARVKPPAHDALYCIFVAPGYVLADPRHGASSCESAGYHWASNEERPFAVLPWNAADFDTVASKLPDYVTIAMSRLLVNAITNPLPASRPAWYSPDGSEVGDVCDSGASATIVDGYTVASFWSNRARACIFNT